MIGMAQEDTDGSRLSSVMTWRQDAKDDARKQLTVCRSEGQLLWETGGKTGGCAQFVAICCNIEDQHVATYPRFHPCRSLNFPVRQACFHAPDTTLNAWPSVLS